MKWKFDDNLNITASKQVIHVTYKLILNRDLSKVFE